MTSLALACRLGAGSPITLPRRVRSILSKYGATLLMPGPAVPILGPELVVGGSFDSAAGWTLFGDSGAISGGVANLTRTSAYTIFERTIQVEANKNYLVSFESRRASGTGVPVLQLRTASNTAGSVVAAASNASPTSQFATNSVNYTAASSATLYVQAGIGTAAAEVSIDSVSVREVLGYQNTYSSFVAGNYRESAGQNPAGVDQQVGLVVDAARSPGPELLSSDGSGNSTTGWSANLGGTMSSALGRVRIAVPAGNADRAVSLAIPTVAGKTYSVSLVGYLGTLAGYWALRVSSEFSGATPIVQTGNQTGNVTPVRLTFTGTGSNIYVTFVAVGSAPGQYGEFNNISVRELPGIHASQATSGFQPYLRQVPKTLGPELVVGAWGTATGVSVAGSGTDASIAFSNAGTGAASANLGAENVMQAGRKYRLTYTITNYSSGQFQFQSGGGGYASALRSANGAYSEEISPTAAATLVAKAQVSGSTFTVSNISIREVLDWAYAWQFDGVDDRLPLTSLPLSSGDDFYQAFALRCATSGANKTFADLLTNPTTGTRLGCLRINGANALQVVHANDAGGVNTVAGRTVIDGQLLVVEALRVGTSHTVFADGAVDIQTTLSGSYTTTHATIGARGAGTSEPYLGHIHGSIVCKGSPSGGERATIRRFLAQLQGRSL